MSAWSHLRIWSGTHASSGGRSTTACACSNHGPGRAPSVMTGSPRLSIKDSDWPALEEALGHRFADRELLKRALPHPSLGAAHSNERLEFLGARVLGLIVADRLYKDFPAEAEG